MVSYLLKGKYKLRKEIQKGIYHPFINVAFYVNYIMLY